MIDILISAVAIGLVGWSFVLMFKFKAVLAWSILGLLLFATVGAFMGVSGALPFDGTHWFARIFTLSCMLGAVFSWLFVFVFIPYHYIKLR